MPLSLLGLLNFFCHLCSWLSSCLSFLLMLPRLPNSPSDQNFFSAKVLHRFGSAGQAHNTTTAKSTEYVFERR